MKKLLGCILLFLCGIHLLQGQTVSTVAGIAGVSGSANGIGSSARFNTPHGIAIDKNGNIYIADRLNHLIRKMDANGVVSTFAGSGLPGAVDATGTAASFFEPYGIACDTTGNVYVADTKNFKIRKITPAGTVTTVAGTGIFGTTNGPANTARFGYPVGVAVTPNGNTIYVSDYNTHVIRQITNGTVNTIAGLIYVFGNNNGTGSAATFNHPAGLAMDSNNDLLIADEWNNQIRRMTSSGVVTTIAGSGMPGSADGNVATATFNGPTDVLKVGGNQLLIADALNHCIRKIDLTTQQVSLYAGTLATSGSSDGPSANAKFNTPYALGVSPLTNTIYICDQLNHTVRSVITNSNIQLNAITPATACFNDSISITINPTGLTNYSIRENNIVLGSSNSNIVKIAPLNPGAHSLIATAIDGSGALASSNSINITVANQFIPTITATSTTFCAGDSVLLSAQSGTSYLWSNGATSQNIYATIAGNYKVTVTNNSGCKGTSAITTVNVLTTSPASITPSNTTVCPGTSTILTASAGTSYLWSNGIATQTITATSGTYTVTITQSNGCTAKSSVVIATHSVTPPLINPSGTQQLIPGDSILLTASGAQTYTWNNGATTPATYVINIGTYTVSSVDSNGCTSSSSIQIIPFNISSLLTVNGTLRFCESDSTYLSAAFPNGNQWFFNNQAIVGATNQVYYPEQSGYYKVRVTIGTNLVFSDSVNIIVDLTPAVPQLQDLTICSGYSAEINANNIGNATIHWYTSDIGGTKLYTGNTYITMNLDQTTDFYAEAVSSEGCISGSRGLVTVTVIQSPIADFTHTVNHQGGSWNVQFNNQSTSAQDYLWLFGDSATSSDVDPLHVYNQTTDYPVTLIAISSNGCSDTLTKTVSLFNNTGLFVPTTFTPNNDGKNDVFRVRGDRMIVEEMKIFSQWGTLLWQGNGAAAQWDGLSGGDVVPNGTYYYRIRVTENSGNQTELTGTVTVIK